MKQVSKALAAYCAVIITLFALVLLLPANPMSLEQFGVSAGQYRVLLFLVELPSILIWLTAFYGYAKLEQYAAVIKGTNESPGFRRLSLGYKWLAWWLPIQAIPYLIAGSITDDHRGLHIALIIASNYLSVLFAVIGLHLVFKASRTLLQGAKIKPTTMKRLTPLTVFFAILAAAYCWITLRHASGQHNPYFIPPWLIVLTLLLPYLYAWYRGLQAAYNIVNLAHHSSGVLYRNALGRVANGVAVVIVSLIAVQILRSTIPRTGHVSLSGVLVAIYVIYLFMGAGYSILALGSHRLKRIEEV